MFLIRYRSNMSLKVLTESGMTVKGTFETVPALLRNGHRCFKDFGGCLPVKDTVGLQRVKLVGFNDYSLDGGSTWIRLQENTYMVGVYQHDTFYLVTFQDGKPRSIPYEPVSKHIYKDNVFHLKSN